MKIKTFSAYQPMIIFPFIYDVNKTKIFLKSNKNLIKKNISKEHLDELLPGIAQKFFRLNPDDSNGFSIPSAYNIPIEKNDYFFINKDNKNIDFVEKFTKNTFPFSIETADIYFFKENIAQLVIKVGHFNNISVEDICKLAHVFSIAFNNKKSAYNIIKINLPNNRIELDIAAEEKDKYEGLFKDFKTIRIIKKETFKLILDKFSNNCDLKEIFSSKNFSEAQNEMLDKIKNLINEKYNNHITCKSICNLFADIVDNITLEDLNIEHKTRNCLYELGIVNLNDVSENKILNLESFIEKNQYLFEKLMNNIKYENPEKEIIAKNIDTIKYNVKSANILTMANQNNVFHLALDDGSSFFKNSGKKKVFNNTFAIRFSNHHLYLYLICLFQYFNLEKILFETALPSLSVKNVFKIRMLKKKLVKYISKVDYSKVSINPIHTSQYKFYREILTTETLLNDARTIINMISNYFDSIFKTIITFISVTLMIIGLFNWFKKFICFLVN